MIKGEKVRLRPIEEKDLELLRSWRNRYFDQFFSGETLSKEQHRAWYDRYNASGGRDTMFIIEALDGNGAVGTIALYDVSIADRTAKLGRVLLLQEFRGKGYMDEAVKLLTNFAFDKLRLYKVRVEVFLDNTAALTIYAHAGYKTTSRPIILMEKVNHDHDPRKPIDMVDLGLED